jgi:UDP-N-acetylglucosamine 2-epimerase
MLDDAFSIPRIRPDTYIFFRSVSPSLSDFTSSSIKQVDATIQSSEASLVLIHGDKAFIMETDMAVYFDKVQIGLGEPT